MLSKKFGKIISVTLAVLIIFASVPTFSVFAETEGLFKYTVSGGKATITGLVDKNTSGAIEIPDTIGGYSVTSIGSRAFYYCTGLTLVTIPDSVTWIGSSAFYNCRGLTSITIPDSVTHIESGAFYDCTGLTSITIPDSVTSIGDWAFSGCTGLTSITIPEGVTSISYQAFAGCTGLTSITIPDSVTHIVDFAFQGCTGLTSITIPDSVTSIDDGAFFRCSGLESITVDGGNKYYHSAGNCLIKTASKTLLAGCKNSIIPNDASVTSIGDHAFYDCTGLTSVTLPDSVTSIGDDAFYNCTGLTSITIPDSVTSIGAHAFYDCTGLTSITIPDSVTSIGVYAFSGCSGLESITVDGGNKYYHSAGNCFIRTSSKTLLAGCKNSIIPNDASVTSIGNSAFYNCTGLTSITIPDSVTSIGHSAFYNCSGLTTVNYTGTEEQRNQIKIEVNNDPLINATWIYNYVEIEIIASGNCGDNLTWTLDSEGLLTISGTGDMYDYDYNTFPWYSYRDTINAVEFEGEVTSIGDSAFYECTGLTSITIPEGVTSIGEGAFCDCTGLTSVTLPDSVISIGDFAFYDCTGLTSITIPDSVTAIGYSAFGYCTGLTSIIISDSVISIDQYAFSRCTNLISILVDEENQYYSSEDGILFNKSQTEIVCYPAGKTGDYAIPSKITSINSSAFCGCEGLTSVTIPNNVTFIGYGAFCDCTRLTSVAIPNNVTSINDYAFNGCTGLTSVTIPNSVTSIGWMAFLNCSGLTTVYYTGTEEQRNQIEIYDYNDPLINAIWVYNYSEIEIIASGTCGANLTWTLDSEGLLTISGTGKMYGFSSASPWYSYRDSINSVEFEGEITSIGMRAFSGCSSITSIEIPSSVTSIGMYAFYDCSGLTGITIPDGVTRIETYTFYGCSGLTSVTIPEGVTMIGASAFSGCSSLTGVTIPDSVTNIGYKAFEDCSGLTSITMGNGVTVIGYMAFSDCSQLSTVYYTGIEKQRNRITIDSENDYLINATWYCKECEHENTEIRNAVYATCTQNGYTGDTYCLDCDEKIADGEVIFSPGHIFNDWEVVIPFSCVTDGLEQRVCTVCGEVEEQIIPAHHNEILLRTVAPTCTEGGCDLLKCTVCGLRRQINFTEALGHSYVHVGTIEPTCTEQGFDVHSCEICGDTYYDNYTKPHGHSYVHVGTIEPTCTEQGFDVHSCEICGDTYYDNYTETIEHNYRFRSTVATSCVKAGYHLYTCTGCGGTKKTQIPALGHYFVDGFCADCGVSEIVAPLDLNGDTEANAADLVIIVNSLIADEEYNDLYDLNHDGNVNILDLITLKKQFAKLV